MMSPEDFKAFLEKLDETQGCSGGTKPPEHTRESCLAEAKRCVIGEREEQYGSPEDNFEVIAQLWTTYIKAKCAGADACIDICKEDVAAMMVLFKVGRIASGQGKFDNWVDIAGYAACGAEVEG